MKRALTFAVMVSFAFPVLGAITKDPGPIPELRPPRTELTIAAETKRDLRPWFIGTGVFAVIAAILASIPRKQPPAPPSAYAVARTKLEALTQSGTSPENLVAVFREYLLGAFKITARGATTLELIHWLSAHPYWDVRLEAETAEILDSCDEVKFSPIPPQQPPTPVERVGLLIARIEERRRLAANPVPVTSQP